MICYLWYVKCMIVNLRNWSFNFWVSDYSGCMGDWYTRLGDQKEFFKFLFSIAFQPKICWSSNQWFHNASTLLCLIVGGSRKRGKAGGTKGGGGWSVENYQDFKWTWGFFHKMCNLTPPTIRNGRIIISK